jgi:YceI-like domain
MSVTDLTLNATGLPVGTWRLDPVHSSASFALKHMAVATFRGRFERLDATLTVDGDTTELVGTVDAGSVVVKDENLQAHLGSPDSSTSSATPRSLSVPPRSAARAVKSSSTVSLRSRATPGQSRLGARSTVLASRSAGTPRSALHSTRSSIAPSSGWPSTRRSRRAASRSPTRSS